VLLKLNPSTSVSDWVFNGAARLNDLLDYGLKFTPCSIDLRRIVVAEPCISMPEVVKADAVKASRPWTLQIDVRPLGAVARHDIRAEAIEGVIPALDAHLRRTN
jgi:hypothetical protein